MHATNVRDKPYKAIGAGGDNMEIAVATVYHIDVHVAGFRVGDERQLIAAVNPGLVGRRPAEPTAQEMRTHVTVNDVHSIALAR
jgi:hypothetical protein